MKVKVLALAVTLMTAGGCTSYVYPQTVDEARKSCEALGHKASYVAESDIAPAAGSGRKVSYVVRCSNGTIVEAEYIYNG
jgi:hypothetical protein